MPTRRSFLAASAASAATLAACGFADGQPNDEKKSRSKSVPSTQSKKLKVGLIGVNGRGWSHVESFGKLPNAEVVAVCDVDTTSLVKAARYFPTVPAFVSAKSLIAVPGLEAVCICVPDHNHATLTAAALHAGKHVYCEKPLTHTIAESRVIAKLAAETGLVTQTGVQNHSASDSYRRTVELIHSGAIGPVHEVHIWHNRVRRPLSDEFAPIPAALNYDLWIGPQATRPFRKSYHPYSWRHWWDFGNAELGDQSSHFLDLVFWCLGLTHATKVSAQSGEAVRPDIVCDHITAQVEFPARTTEQGDQPPVKLYWYDNPQKPPDIDKWNLPAKSESSKGTSLHDEGIMFIGEKGMLCTNYTERALLPQEKFKDFTPPPQTLGPARSHQGNFVDACLKNDPKAAGAPFDYGALLAEVPMLCTIAYRAGKTLEWDWQNMKFPNAPEADKFLSYQYREGWTL